MIKQVTIAECDICGTTQQAKPVQGQYNETDYQLPPGWMMSEANKKFCICPKCWKKMSQ